MPLLLGYLCCRRHASTCAELSLHEYGVQSVDDFHCFPIGRGKMEKVSKFGTQYTVLGTLPPNKSMCSICWSEGHWKNGCPFKDMVVELWEPALAVLVPADRLRKYYPCRNIVCERYQHDKDNNFQYYYPAVALVDYGAVNHRISEINSRRYRGEKAKDPEAYPEIEPPEDEREGRPPLSTEQAMEYAASKKAAKPSDPEQRMASHTEALLEMQDQAKRRRAKQVEKESKKKAIDVDEESTSKQEGSASKKARGGKGQGDDASIWTKESLPPGHGQDRPKSISSQSHEAKAALREKLEAHRKEQDQKSEAQRKEQEQFEEHHKQKLQKTIATHFEKEASKTEAVAAKKDLVKMKRDRIPAVKNLVSHRTQPRTKNVVAIWCRRHRNVQKPNLLRRVPVSVPNQSKGKMPTYVALGLLLVLLLLQLILNCAKFGPNCIRNTRKSAPSCICMRRKVNRMHSIRWRRRVSHYKRSMKLFVFALLIVRTEAMEAAGSPGSIGADVPPVAAHMQPIPDDGLGMTPTAEILTQLVQNSRVTTNAISQCALVQQEASASASASTFGSYEGTLSKALEGAVKMLGRPPLFGGGKTEVYDFMDFKEQLYNILAYAEPKYTDAFRSLEKLGDDEGVPERFTNEEHQVMSTKLYSLLSSWLTGTTKQHARDPSIATSRNGFALSKSLLRIYQPSTRSRSLALMQAIHSYPNFSPGVSSIAQISKLEELVKDYERCSGQSYLRETLLSTLLRCIPSPLKEHIHLQLTDRTMYAQVKESVLVS